MYGLKMAKKIEPNDTRVFNNDGTKYCMEIKNVDLDDAGSYSFYKKNYVVAKLDVQEVKINRLKADYKCFDGGCVELTCTVNSEKAMGYWLKADEKFEKENLPKFHALVDENTTRTLKISRVAEENAGNYSFSIHSKSCKINLCVLSYTEGDILHFKLNCCMDEVMKPIVKDIFDKEFKPEKLKEMIKSNKGIVQKLPISRKKRNELFNCCKDASTSTLPDFDIKMMIHLLKEFTNMERIGNRLPYNGNLSKEDDLSRINYILSVLNQQSEIEAEKYEECFNCLKEVAGRLAGNDTPFQSLSNYMPTAEDVYNYFETPNTQEATRRSSFSSDQKIVEETTKNRATKTVKKKLAELVDIEAWSSLNRNEIEHFSEWLKVRKTSQLDFTLLIDLQDTTEEGTTTKKVKDYLKKLDTKLMMIFLKFALHNKFIKWNLGNLVDVATLEILHGQFVKSSMDGMEEAIKHLCNHEDILEKAKKIFTEAKDSKNETVENGGKTSKVSPKAAKDDKKAESKEKGEYRTMVDDIIEEVTKKVLHESVKRLCEKWLKELQDLKKDCVTCEHFKITWEPHRIDWNLAEMWFAMDHATKQHLQPSDERERTLDVIDRIKKPEKERKLKDYIEMIQGIGGELP